MIKGRLFVSSGHKLFLRRKFSDPERKLMGMEKIGIKRGTDIDTLLKQSVLWIRKYFFRIQILCSLILNYGTYPDPIWTYLWLLIQICC